MVNLFRWELLLFNFFLRYLTLAQIIIIFVIFLLIFILFDFLSFDLCLFEYLCDSLSLLLSLRAYNLLLLLSNWEIPRNQHILRGGIEHWLPPSLLVNLQLLPDQLIGIIVLVLRWWRQGLLPCVIGGSYTHMQRVHSSSFDIDMLKIHVIEKRNNLLNILTLFKVPIF